MSNKSIKKNQKTQNKSNESFGLLKLIELTPLLLIAAFFPFIVRMHFYKTNMTQFPWYYNVSSDNWSDFFLYNRHIFFITMAALMVVILVFKFIRDKRQIKISLQIIPIAVYALLAFLSTCFSEYPGFGFHGIFEQFESVFALMGYAIIIYYGFIIVQSEREVKIVLMTVIVSTCIISLIGLGQTLGHDFYGTELGKSLVIPARYNLDYSSDAAAGKTYLTLYNPNYVGVYVALFFPLLLSLLIFSKKIKFSIWYGITAICLLISLYGSGSKAGFLALASALIFFIIFLRKPILKRWYIVVPVFIMMITTFFVIDQYKDGEYITRIKEALTITKDSEYDITSMVTEDDNVALIMKGNELHAAMNATETGLEFVLWDADGDDIAFDFNEETSVASISDERFKGITLQPVIYENILSMGLTYGEKTWYFTTNNSEDPGVYYFLTEKGKMDRMIMAESAVFTDYTNIFTGRGYIWSRTIPLLKKNIILGSGADTFSIEFPQQDYLMLYYEGYSTQLMSKPHCMYLQIAVQTGVLSLIALLVFYGIYFVTSIRIYMKQKFEGFLPQAGVGIFLGTIGYMVSGISNDSSMATAPMFWLLMALGVAINAIVSQNKVHNDSSGKE